MSSSCQGTRSCKILLAKCSDARVIMVTEKTTHLKTIQQYKGHSKKFVDWHI